MSQWIYLLSYAIPELFGLGIALVLLLTNARHSSGRRLGLIGIGIMAFAALGGLCLGILQNLLITGASGDGAVDLQQMLAALGAAHVAFHLVSTGGLLTVVWGLCRATRETGPH